MPFGLVAAPGISDGGFRSSRNARLRYRIGPAGKRSLRNRSHRPTVPPARKTTLAGHSVYLVPARTSYSYSFPVNLILPSGFSDQLVTITARATTFGIAVNTTPHCVVTKTIPPASVLWPMAETFMIAGKTGAIRPEEPPAKQARLHLSAPSTSLPQRIPMPENRKTSARRASFQLAVCLPRAIWKLATP